MPMPKHGFVKDVYLHFDTHSHAKRDLIIIISFFSLFFFNILKISPCLLEHSYLYSVDAVDSFLFPIIICTFSYLSRFCSIPSPSFVF